ncbi:MAG: LamG-like jellyroll fold domain-containing protein [Candidatus Paceibacterota bacterium]
MQKINAFTLIELLVVIAIIGILSALIVVGMSSTTQKATIAKSQVFANSLRNSLMGDLVSEWKLDGSTNDTWAASFANNGTWSGPTAPNTVATYGTVAECVSGQCMDFDGVDDMVNFGNNASLSMGTKDHTISLWVKFDDAIASQWETLFACGDAIGNLNGYWLNRHTGEDRLYLYFSNGTTRSTYYLSASGTLTANTWYNIVVTLDRDSVAQAYINGAKQTAYSPSIVAEAGDVQNSMFSRIGAYSAGPQYILNGKLDEVRIFHAITTISQIEQNYFVGLNKLLASTSISKQEYDQRLATLNSNYAEK